MKLDTRKLKKGFILALPYLMVGLICTNLRHTRYAALMAELKSGWLDFKIKGLRNYRMYMSEPSAPKWYPLPSTNGKYICIFKVKFREPEPVLNND